MQTDKRTDGRMDRGAFLSKQPVVSSFGSDGNSKSTDLDITGTRAHKHMQCTQRQQTRTRTRSSTAAVAAHQGGEEDDPGKTPRATMSCATTETASLGATASASLRVQSTGSRVNTLVKGFYASVFTNRYQLIMSRFVFMIKLFHFLLVRNETVNVINGRSASRRGECRPSGEERHSCNNRTTSS
jgi:hypothetical protein